MDNVYVENEALTVENRALVGIVQSQQSRIADLEAEVARLTLFNKECRKTLNDVSSQRDNAWNDAIEAAAEKSRDAWASGYDATPHIRALKREEPK